MRADIADGPATLAQAVAEYRELEATIGRLSSVLLGVRSQHEALTRVLLDAIPSESEAVRGGGVVVFPSLDGRAVCVEPDTPGIEMRLFERLAKRKRIRRPDEYAREALPGDFTCVERRDGELVAR